MPLRVAVVGAGIAGLSTSISLRRAGHMVDVFERSSSSASELGAAINVPPNAARPLLRWGLDAAAAKFVRVRDISMCDPFTLRQCHRVPVGEFVVGRFGAPFYFAHRVDLHDELKRMATGPGGLAIPARIHFKSEVQVFDPQTPTLRLTSGQVVQPDLVIAADGIHSRAVSAVVGKPSQPQAQSHYNTCYRFLIPTSVLNNDPETSWFTTDRDGKMSIYMDNESKKRLVCYPCRNNEVQNFVGICHDDSMRGSQREDWHAEASKDRMLDMFNSFNPAIVKVLSKATEVKHWPLLYRAPLSTWVNGRIALAGDAAHPMLPHQGQGGAQAIEDGVALGVVLKGATVGDIPERLAAYERIRINRASAIQVLSNAGQDETDLTYKEAAKYLGSEDAVPKNPQQFTEYNFGHDVEVEAEKYLASLQPGASFPTPPQQPRMVPAQA